jgi:1,4-alpha-glucan branching enzyme
MIIRNRKWVTIVYRPRTECREVYVAGTFNNWSPNVDRLLRQKDGTFRKRLQLDPGRYEYRFIVDGAWQDDAEADGYVLNEFGTQNAVVAVS